MWCSLSDDSFRHVNERWNAPHGAGDGYFGWLCSPIAGYPSTIHLKTHVRSRAVGQVPLIELHECDHPLYVDQRNGITVERVREFAHILLHAAAAHAEG